MLNGNLLNTAAEKSELRKPLWAYRFWRAAHDGDVRRAYVKAAIARIERFYPAMIAALGQRPMSDYITSEVGVAHILDQHVNRPENVPRTLVTAVRAHLAAGGPADPTTWTDKDEAKVIEIYLSERLKTSMTDSGPRAARIQAQATRGKLSSKRGSFKP